MSKTSRIIFGAVITALASQLYLDVLVADFRVTCALIALSVFIYENRDISPILMGFLSAISVSMWRVTIAALDHAISAEFMLGFIPELFFYPVYGFIIYQFVHRGKRFALDRYFMVVAAADFSSNVVEILIRMIWYDHPFYSGIVTTLLIVALIRASAAVMAIFLFHRQRLLVVREEHEKRYRRLLWLTSLLKSEMYWMDKSMDRVEVAMTQAYQHFESIQRNERPELWAEEAVQIAGSIHEIKKEYELVLRGVQDLTDVRYTGKGMMHSNILSILDEKMQQEARRRNAAIRLKIEQGRDFFTEHHFLLMSVFRNLINNAFDAAEKYQQPVLVQLTHWTDNEDHVYQIEDDGTGIDQETLSHIFEPGFSTKINYETGEINRGLGLSIVHSIVSESLGGTIAVSSIKNEYTRFTIRIPIHALEDNQ